MDVRPVPPTVAPAAGYPAGADPRDGATGSRVPAVVVVLVAHDPGPWFEETLASLGAQTYPKMVVLVIDAASIGDIAGRVAATLPKAFIRRLSENPGFGAAANTALTSVAGAPYLLLCHDDIALEPDTVNNLVEEAFRTNAGIVGPKLLDWNEPEELRQVGAAVDKTGVLAPFAEPGELDQEQHDAVRDVFVIPGACTLVRTDLFTALGGFDPAMSYLGEDIDLCWRAHVAGGRVIVAPQARVRHLEALGVRRPVDDRRKLQSRHRIRSMLSCYRPFHLLRVVPQALVLSIVEFFAALAAGDRRHARDVSSAWTWNLRRLGQVWKKRRALRKVRRVPDHEVRTLQVHGSARLTEYIRGQIGRRDDRLAAVTQSGRDFANTLRLRSTRAAVIAALMAVMLVLLGSRNLITSPLPTVGELVPFPHSPRPLLDQWLSFWRPVGVGQAGPAPTGIGLLAILGYLSAGAMGVLQKLLVLGMLPLGGFGAWRLAKPIGSMRASVAALVVYLASPLPYNALAQGSWSGVILYGVAPWLLVGLARISDLTPFERRPRGGSSASANGDEGATAGTPRLLSTQVLRTGLLVAVVAAFVPIAGPVIVIVGLALALGTLVAGGGAAARLGARRLVLGSLVIGALAFVLNLPWSATTIAPGGGWHLLAGIGAGVEGRFAVGDLLRFETGPFGAAPLGWAYLAPAILPLVIGKGWRLEWAIRAWFVALSGWTLLWIGQQGWLPVGLPPHEVLLAPAGAALALAAALGMAAFETDLPGYRFGWRQAVSGLAAIGLLVAIFPLVPGFVDGRWKLTGGGFGQPLAEVIKHDKGEPSRLLWLGRPDVLPVAGHEYSRNVDWTVTDGIPTVRDRWAAPMRTGDRLLVESVRLARDRRTVHLGALLAPFGVRYVVVPQRSKPSAFRDTAAGKGDDPRRNTAPAWLTETLAGQLDLERVEVDPALIVYRNAAWRPLVSLAPNDGRPRATYTSAVDDNPALFKGALRRRGVTTWSGSLPAGSRVGLAAPASSGWSLSTGGSGVQRARQYGWAQAFVVAGGGAATIHFRTPWLYRVGLLLQVAGWIVVLTFIGGGSVGGGPAGPRQPRSRAERRAALGTSGVGPPGADTNGTTVPLRSSPYGAPSPAAPPPRFEDPDPAESPTPPPAASPAPPSPSPSPPAPAAPWSPSERPAPAVPWSPSERPAPAVPWSPSERPTPAAPPPVPPARTPGPAWGPGDVSRRPPPDRPSDRTRDLAADDATDEARRWDRPQ